MSKLKVDELRSADRSVSDSANITLADNGNVSLGGTLSAGDIGSSVTGYTGVKAFQQFRLTTGIDNTSSETDITTNISEVSGGLNSNVVFGSGAFTFNLDGIYWVMANFAWTYDNEATYINGYIKADSGSGYVKVAKAITNRFDASSGNVESGATCNYLFDVTSTGSSGHKIMFSWEAEDTSNLQGHGSQNRTYFTFLRIGDT